MKARIWLMGLLVAAVAQAEEPKKVDFAKEVAPIFEATCIRCHGPAKQKGKLRLDSKEAAMKGGENNAPNIIPGKSKDSDLVRRLNLADDDDDVMPAKGERLTKEQIQLIATWIDQGANWPDGLTLTDKAPPEKKK